MSRKTNYSWTALSGFDNMLELMASGMSMEELLSDYPDLEKEDFLACIDYAAKLTQIKSIYRLAS
jgi:uncharacterized protein (DUF433 family)